MLHAHIPMQAFHHAVFQGHTCSLITVAFANAVCDPVMGDDGRLYLAPELVPIYKTNIAKLATVLTPNQYEAELLSGVKITSKQTALDACQVLHEHGTQTVVGV